LSEAKDPCIEVDSNAEVLRFAQDDSVWVVQKLEAKS